MAVRRRPPRNINHHHGLHVSPSPIFGSLDEWELQMWQFKMLDAFRKTLVFILLDNGFGTLESRYLSISAQIGAVEILNPLISARIEATERFNP